MTDINPLEILFFGIIFGIAGLMWGLALWTGKAHFELDKFQSEAEATDDLDKLSDINICLVQYAWSHCFFNSSSIHAQEVYVYIRTKSDTIRKFTAEKQ